MKKPVWNPYWLNTNRQRILGRDSLLVKNEHSTILGIPFNGLNRLDGTKDYLALNFWYDIVFHT